MVVGKSLKYLNLEQIQNDLLLINFNALKFFSWI